MNVQEFVHSTLVQIARAVVMTNKTFESESLSASAVPKGAELNSHGSTTYQSVTDTFDIKFDIAVTVDSNQSNDVRVVNTDTESKTTSSRIQFSVPLKLPRGEQSV